MITLLITNNNYHYERVHWSLECFGITIFGSLRDCHEIITDHRGSGPESKNGDPLSKEMPKKKWMEPGIPVVESKRVTPESWQCKFESMGIKWLKPGIELNSIILYSIQDNYILFFILYKIYIEKCLEAMTDSQFVPQKDDIDRSSFWDHLLLKWTTFKRTEITRICLDLM